MTSKVFGTEGAYRGIAMTPKYHVAKAIGLIIAMPMVLSKHRVFRTIGIARIGIEVIDCAALAYDNLLKKREKKA